MHKFKIHWPSALLALLMAVIVWYTVTGRERVETWVGVRLEIKGVPAGYVMLDGNNLPGRLEVRLRGPSGLIRNLTGQDIPLVLNLSQVDKGRNIIPLTRSDLPISGAFEVMEIRPPSIEVDIDVVEEKTVKVVPLASVTLPPGITKITYTLSPKEIKIKGPSSILKPITRVEALVNLPDKINTRQLSLNSYISLPTGVEATPANVAITANIEGRDKQIEITRNIVINSAPARPDMRPGLKLEPPVVKLTLGIPFDWDEKNRKLSEVQARVDLSDYAEIKDGQLLKVKTALPEEVTLLYITPTRVKLMLK